jgi:hypothetical protein
MARFIMRLHRGSVVQVETLPVFGHVVHGEGEADIDALQIAIGAAAELPQPARVRQCPSIAFRQAALPLPS